MSGERESWGWLSREKEKLCLPVTSEREACPAVTASYFRSVSFLSLISRETLSHTVNVALK